MKTRLLSLAIALATSYYAAAQAGPTLSAADKAAIETTLGQFRKNLDDHKFSEMPTYTTPDISFVNVVGMFWQGELNVQAAHQAIFDRLYKDVKLPPADPSKLIFRAITPDVVLVTSRSTAPARSDGGAAPTGDSGQSIFNTLLVKRGGKWLITMGQNTPVNTQAAAANPIR